MIERPIKKIEIVKADSPKHSNVNKDELYPIYEVKNDNGKYVDVIILQRYFGNLWRIALSQLNHQFDGFLMSIYQQGQEFKIYRKFESITPQKRSHLRLIKS